MPRLGLNFALRLECGPGAGRGQAAAAGTAEPAGALGGLPALESAQMPGSPVRAWQLQLCSGGWGSCLLLGPKSTGRPSPPLLLGQLQLGQLQLCLGERGSCLLLASKSTGRPWSAAAAGTVAAAPERVGFLATHSSQRLLGGHSLHPLSPRASWQWPLQTGCCCHQ